MGFDIRERSDRRGDSRWGEECWEPRCRRRCHDHCRDYDRCHREECWEPRCKRRCHEHEHCECYHLYHHFDKEMDKEWGSKELGQKRKREDRDVVLNASTASIGPLGIITTLTTPIPIVSTNIDTTIIGKTTDNLLNFTANIGLPIGALTNFSFVILRSFNGGTPVPIATPFTFIAPASVATSSTIAFQYFDSDVPPGFYTYTVAINTGSTITVAGATITATLSVLAVQDEA